MKFLFQEIHKDPKRIQLWKIYRSFSHDRNTFKQQYKTVVLKVLL